MYHQRSERLGIFFSALIIAIGGIIYELIIGTVSSYILGNSVLQFSLTIGLMLFGMGLGALIAPKIKADPASFFVCNEALIALIGGSAPVLLLAVFATQLSFYIFYIVLVVIIGILIGMEIPIMFKILTEKNKEVEILSRILALDYIGALIASLAFPLLLLPYFGLIRTAFLVGILNVLIAILILFSFRRMIVYKKILGAFCGVVITILSFGLYHAHTIALHLDQHLYYDEILYSAESPYQKIVLTKFKNDLRLFLDGNIQFSSIDEYRYHEPLVHIPMSIAPHRNSVLVLGGGDGLVVRELLKYDDITTITLVDLDKEITALASTHPLLKDLNHNALLNNKVVIRNVDAMEFLMNTEEYFDVIIADLPDPNNESLAKLYSTGFYALTYKRLAEDGVFVTQATSPYFSNTAFWTIKATMDSAEFITFPYHVQVPTFGEWGFVMGLKNYTDVTKTEIANTISTRFLSNEGIPSLFTFDKDLRYKSTTEPTPSTIDNPSILDAYSEDAKRWMVK